MSKAPIITKIKTLSVLMTQPWYGSMYHNVALPFAEGIVVLRNMSNIDIDYNGEKYVIRVDTLAEKDYLVGLSSEEKLEKVRVALLQTIQQFQELHKQFMSIGITLYKDLTGADTIERALQITNSFLKDGVNVIAKKKEDGMHYSFPINGRLHTTTDSSELFAFLGSLANVYMINKGVPDARWFNENKPDDFPF